MGVIKLAISYDKKFNKRKEKEDVKQWIVQECKFVTYTCLTWAGVPTFSEPLKACCEGRKGGNSCGDVDIYGRRLYSVCKDPKSFFFWDNVHITDEGWRSVFSLLLPDSR